jgi:hypothetical protein
VGIGNGSPTATLQVQSARATAIDNTATFFNPALGPNASHIHYGESGDWYIRSATDTGKVILQDSGGEVGIGTPSPQANLHVALPGSANPVSAMKLEVGTFGTVANSVASTFLTVRDVGSGQMAFMIRGDGNVGIGTASPQARLDVAGMTRTCVLQITGGCDLAEPFQMSETDLPKGSLVIIDAEHEGNLKLAGQEYDTRVAGIISGANGVNPGISLHQEGVIEGGQNVALTGRVYALADASYGSIKPGDLLTSSSTPGHVMKVTDHGRAQGAIVGKAMSALKEGKGIVLVLVSLQ